MVIKKASAWGCWGDDTTCQYMKFVIISVSKAISPRLYLFIEVGPENTTPLLLISSNFHYDLQNMKFI